MNKLQRELFILASKPEAQLSGKEREIFDFYVNTDFQESAEHGNFFHLLYPDTPESVSSCLESLGFDIFSKGNKVFASWKKAAEGTIAYHFRQVAESPLSHLTSLERTQYLEFAERARAAAKEGKFAIHVPASILPEVRKVLGLHFDSKEFSWAIPEGSEESVPVPYSVE